MLAGTGWLYAGDERFRVGPGDFFAKGEGPKLVHQFVNDGRRTCASSRSASTARTMRSSTRRPPGCPKAARPTASEHADALDQTSASTASGMSKLK